MNDRPTTVASGRPVRRSRRFVVGLVFAFGLVLISLFGWQRFTGAQQAAGSEYPPHQILDHKYSRVTFSATVDGVPVTGAVTKTCNLEIDETAIKLHGGPTWRAASTGMSVPLPGREAILIDIPSSLVCLSDGRAEIGLYDHGFNWAVIADDPARPNVLEYYRYETGFIDNVTGKPRPGSLPVGSRIVGSSILLSSEPAKAENRENSESDDEAEWYSRRGQRYSGATTRMIGFRAFFVDKAEWSQFPEIVAQVEGRTEPIWLDRAVLPHLPFVGGRGISMSPYARPGDKSTYMAPGFWAPLIHLGDNVWQVQSEKREVDLAYRFDQWPPTGPGGAKNQPLFSKIRVRLDDLVPRLEILEQVSRLPVTRYLQIMLFDPNSQRLIYIVSGMNLRNPPPRSDVLPTPD